jgi:hypothetical protein
MQLHIKHVVHHVLDGTNHVPVNISISHEKEFVELGNSNHGVITLQMFMDWKMQRNIAKIGNPEPTIERNEFCDQEWDE